MPIGQQNVFSKRQIKSLTPSFSFCAQCRKSWAAIAFTPDSKRLCKASTPDLTLVRSESGKGVHSRRARPLRLPASCISSSSSVQPFQVDARWREGNQSSRHTSGVFTRECVKWWGFTLTCNGCESKQLLVQRTGSLFRHKGFLPDCPLLPPKGPHLSLPNARNGKEMGVC